MADEPKPEGGIPSTVVFIVGLLAVLGALWWVQGGPNRPQPGADTTNTPPSDYTNVDANAQVDSQY
ncbi:MAG: hypothetical protein NT019_01250 [Candidatus Adlerbacteria bacterium]|nr:hypothetical protein [Candidatus Adlerbacteria bacterium]